MDQLSPMGGLRADRETRENAIRDFIIDALRKTKDEDDKSAKIIQRPFYVLDADEPVGGSSCRIELVTEGQRIFMITIEQVD